MFLKQKISDIKTWKTQYLRKTQLDRKIISVFVIDHYFYVRNYVIFLQSRVLFLPYKHFQCLKMMNRSTASAHK